MPYNVCFHDCDATQYAKENEPKKKTCSAARDVSKSVRYVLAVHTLAYSVTLSFAVWGFVVWCVRNSLFYLFRFYCRFAIAFGAKFAL